MTEHEFLILLMMCGALNDIAENTQEDCTRRQVSEVQNKIENLVTESEVYSKIIGYKELKF